MILNIKRIKANTIIGVHAWEKESDRILYIDLEIEFDSKEAIQTDKISDTVDYDELCDVIIEETAKTRFDLIEKLARHLLEMTMKNKKISRAKIEIEKPGAVKEAESIKVIDELTR